MQVFPKSLDTSFDAFQFTEGWKENPVLKDLCKKYKGDEYLVNETKQRVSFGDYVLVSGSTVLVVSEEFFKENFSESQMFIAVTMTEEHEVVAVSLQDEEHRIHKLVWERSEFEKRVAEEAEAEERSEDDTTLQIKQYFLRNQVIEILSDGDVVLEKRIEQIKKLVAETAPDVAKLAVEYVKETLDIDLSSVKPKKQKDRQPKRADGERNARPAPKKAEAPKHHKPRPMFTVNTRIAYPF